MALAMPHIVLDGSAEPEARANEPSKAERGPLADRGERRSMQLASSPARASQVAPSPVEHHASLR